MEAFLESWFSHPEWWFNKECIYDKHIIQEFENLLDVEHSNIIGQVIVYDQLPRHIFRNNSSAHVITYFTKKAVDLVEANIQLMEAMTMKEWVFFNLPLRHMKDIQKIFQVMKRCWERLSIINESDAHLLKRFMHATYMNAQMQDQTHSLESYNLQQSNFADRTFQSFLNILEYCPEHGALPQIKYKLGNFQMKDVIISLSGGVDSMVCSYIFRMMFPQIPLTAVMINYANREASDQEAQFVVEWCQQMGIVLHIRRIHEIKRDACMQNGLRDVYEDYTRNVRYNTYKTVSNENMPCVILGHNSDDAFENCMTNMTYRTKYENLKGMEHENIVDGVRFIRPLINVSKNDIVKFAKEHNIPFLVNSTPTWSQRGKIRANIVPVLDEWNPCCISGIFVMSDIMKELHNVLLTSVTDFATRFSYDLDAQTYFAEVCASNMPESGIFWQNLINHMIHVIISQKSMKSFMENLLIWKKKQTKEQRCRKFILSKDLTLTIKHAVNEKFQLKFELR